MLLPIKVVPKQIACLSGVEINPVTDLVGAFVTIVKGVPTPALVSHLYNPPFFCHANKSSPALSKCHIPASRITLDVERAVPQVDVPQVLVPQPYP